jgi:hypothetical protein
VAKRKLSCRNCRRPVKAGWLVCPECEIPTERGEMAKAAGGASFIGKAAGPTCRKGHRVKPGARFCTQCGASLVAAKSARDVLAEQEYAIRHNSESTNPEVREQAWKASHSWLQKGA